MNSFNSLCTGKNCTLLSPTGLNMSHDIIPFTNHSQDLDYIIISSYVTPVVCVVGITAILITLGVILMKGLGDSTRIYLTALGFFDLFTLLILLVSALEYFFIYLIDLSIAMYFYRYMGELLNSMLLISNWITAALGVERYIAVSYPFLAKRIRKVHRTSTLALIIVGISIIKFPSFLILSWDQEWEDMNSLVDFNNQSQVSSGEYYGTNSDDTIEKSSTSFGTFRMIYTWIVDFFIFFLAPFLLLTVANIRLIIAVRQSSKFMRKHGDHNSRQRIDRGEIKITTMLVCLIATFLVCQGPICIYTACVSVHIIRVVGQPESPTDLQTIIVFNRYFRAFSILLLVMKSNVNFIFYCWLCDRFRLVLQRMVCRSPPRRNSMMDSTTARHEVYPLTGLGICNQSTRISNVTLM